MSSNEQLIRQAYAMCVHEDGRSSLSRAHSLEFRYTAKIAGKYINRTTSVIEIGCGTGYYGVYFADRCKEYLGVDLSPESIEMFNSKIDKQRLGNVRAVVGDGTNLQGIGDSRYDVVMALGPMYHLPPQERDLVFSECRRICRDRGIIIFAYVNKAGVYVKGCLEFPDRYPDKKLSTSVLKEGISDDMPGVFFFTMPEEMESQARSHGLTVVMHAGVDFVFNEKVVNGMTDEQFEAWLHLCDFMCGSQTCSGLSNHAVIVCRK